MESFFFIEKPTELSLKQMGVIVGGGILTCSTLTGDCENYSSDCTIFTGNCTSFSGSCGTFKSPNNTLQPESGR